MLARQSAPRSEKTLSPAFLIPAFEFFGKSNSRDVGGYALTSLHMSRALRADNSMSTRSASADASEQETVHTGSAGTKRASGACRPTISTTKAIKRRRIEYSADGEDDSSRALRQCVDGGESDAALGTLLMEVVGRNGLLIPSRYVRDKDSEAVL
ncbi:hypothetical protein SCB29_29130 [Paraburkholderia sp. SIMBA_055]